MYLPLSWSSHLLMDMKFTPVSWQLYINNAAAETLELHHLFGSVFIFLNIIYIYICIFLLSRWNYGSNGSSVFSVLRNPCCFFTGDFFDFTFLLTMYQGFLYLISNICQLFFLLYILAECTHSLRVKIQNINTLREVKDLPHGNSIASYYGQL